MPKVKEFYKEIDLGILEMDQGMNEWTAREYKFVKDVWDKDISEMSKKQIEWLMSISERFDE